MNSKNGRNKTRREPVSWILLSFDCEQAIVQYQQLVVIAKGFDGLFKASPKETKSKKSGRDKRVVS